MLRGTQQSRSKSLDLNGVTAVFYPGSYAGESSAKMEAELYVGNLSKSTTQEELNALFARAGEVTAADVVKDRKSGESKGFAFITMSAQNEADKAVSMFNRYALSEHVLKVSLMKPRQQRGITDPILK
jgi:RNA recognition motif-containing protein